MKLKAAQKLPPKHTGQPIVWREKTGGASWKIFQEFLARCRGQVCRNGHPRQLTSSLSPWTVPATTRCQPSYVKVQTARVKEYTTASVSAGIRILMICWGWDSYSWTVFLRRYPLTQAWQSVWSAYTWELPKLQGMTAFGYLCIKWGQKLTRQSPLKLSCDGAMDNYATYRLLHKWDMILHPLIPMRGLIMSNRTLGFFVYDDGIQFVWVASHTNIVIFISERY